jgi:branched-chain amino acid transport system ATP-binding protein
LALEQQSPPPAPANAAVALELRDIVAGYHGNQVLHGVTIKTHPSEVLLVLGPNGTGKSTLLSVASGLVRPRSGGVYLSGRDVTSEPVHHRAHLGIAHVPDGRRIFPKQSVEDNLLVGSLAGSHDKDSRQRGFDWVYELFPVLQRKRKDSASTLSGGEQQMLAIAQAVMSMPRVLLLDEPSAGLAPLLTKQVFERVQRLKDRQMSVVMVEQVASALTIADRVYVMRTGEVVADGKAEEFKTEELSDKYLGGRAQK